MKIPYIIPIVVGLISTPAAMFAVICGLIGYQMLNTVVTNAMAIHTMGEEEVMTKIRLIVDSLVKNKELLVMIIAFSFTIVVVYMVRRLAIDYAWTIAMAAGAITNLVLLLIGDLMYDTNMSVGGAILGLLLALAVGKVFEFFCFSIDYSRIENVQFEDDEYYYYVKAIPKMTVAAPEKKVKRINIQTQDMPERPNTVDRTAGHERSVMVEHVGTQRRAGVKNERIPGGKSVTVGKRELSEIEEFFENLDEE
jgi:hypothetical protein